MPANPQAVTLMVLERITDRSSLAGGGPLDGLREARPDEVEAALHPSLQAMLTIIPRKAQTPTGPEDDALRTALIAAVEDWVRAGFPIMGDGAPATGRLADVEAERDDYERALGGIRAMCEAAGIPGETLEPDPDDLEDPSPVRTWYSTPRMVERLVKARDEMLDGQERAFAQQVAGLQARIRDLSVDVIRLRRWRGEAVLALTTADDRLVWMIRNVDKHTAPFIRADLQAIRNTVTEAATMEAAEAARTSNQPKENR